ncbi:hypothetical protein MBLNU13_g09312t1 [Cladosporium sp. NU13]
MPAIRASTSPTYTGTIPLVCLPSSRLTAQSSSSSPQTSAYPSRPNVPASVEAAASPLARPTSNLPSNTVTTNLRPPSKPTRSKNLSPTAILAWIGVGLAVAGLILTIFYGKLTMLLAHWTAGNDYRESCRNDRDDGVLLDEKCKEALSHPPKPPPFTMEGIIPLPSDEIGLWETPLWHPVTPNKDMAGDLDMGTQASFWLWSSEASLSLSRFDHALGISVQYRLNRVVDDGDKDLEDSNWDQANRLVKESTMTVAHPEEL